MDSRNQHRLESQDKHDVLWHAQQTTYGERSPSPTVVGSCWPECVSFSMPVMILTGPAYEMFHDRPCGRLLLFVAHIPGVLCFCYNETWDRSTPTKHFESVWELYSAHIICINPNYFGWTSRCWVKWPSSTRSHHEAKLPSYIFPGPYHITRRQTREISAERYSHVAICQGIQGANYGNPRGKLQGCSSQI